MQPMTMPRFSPLRKLAMPILLVFSLFFIISTKAKVNLPNSIAANELCKLALAGQNGNGKTKPASVKVGDEGHWYAWHDAAPLEDSGDENPDVTFKVWYELECDLNAKTPRTKIHRCTIVCAEQVPDSKYEKPLQCVGQPLAGKTPRTEFSVPENQYTSLPKFEVEYVTLQVNLGLNDPKKKGEKTKLKHTIEYQMDCFEKFGAKFEETSRKETPVKEEPTDKKAKKTAT